MSLQTTPIFWTSERDAYDVIEEDYQRLLEWHDRQKTHGGPGSVCPVFEAHWKARDEREQRLEQIELDERPACMGGTRREENRPDRMDRRPLREQARAVVLSGPLFSRAMQWSRPLYYWASDGKYGSDAKCAKEITSIKLNGCAVPLCAAAAEHQETHGDALSRTVARTECEMAIWALDQVCAACKRLEDFPSSSSVSSTARHQAAGLRADLVRFHDRLSVV